MAETIKVMISEEDVAYVPLTAIEMSITQNVTWNGEQYRIDINTK